MSDVLKSSFKTPPPEVEALSPPLSPKLGAKEANAKKGVAIDEPIVDPAPAEVPDNYVAWTLRNTKERPPITMKNILNELNYISLAVLTITPSIAIWGAFHVQLQWRTAAFAVLYYFITGLGITAGMFSFKGKTQFIAHWDIRLPSFVGTSLV